LFQHNVSTQHLSRLLVLLLGEMCFARRLEAVQVSEK
jgi:hypothetical protein